MDSLTSLKENFNIQLNYPELALNLIIAALLAWLLEFVFINYSNSINNKKVFSKKKKLKFVLISGMFSEKHSDAIRVVNF